VVSLEVKDTLAGRLDYLSSNDKFKNLDLERYRDHVNHDQIRQDFSSLLMEMDVMKELIGGATVRQMFYVPEEGFFHSVNGELVKYTDFFDRAIGDTTNQDSIDRFVAEKLGWTRAEKLLKDQSIEMLVVASPPGNTYRFENMMPLSATFVLARAEEGLLIVGGHEKKGYLFDAFAIYVNEIASKEHVDILNNVAELTDSWLDPNNPLSVVATPFVLERLVDSLDRLVQPLGFESWEQIEGRALNLQFLSQEEGDERGVRRAQIMKFLIESVDESLMDNSDLNLSLVSEAIKQILAKEAIGEYSNRSVDEIRKDMLLSILSLHKEVGIETNIHDLIDTFTYAAWLEEQREIQHTALFQRMITAHGGGEAMMLDKNGRPFVLDARASLADILKEKRETSCGKCHKPLNSMGKCTKCNK